MPPPPPLASLTACVCGGGMPVTMSLLSLASLPVPGSLIRLLRAFRIIRCAPARGFPYVRTYVRKI